MHVPHARSLSVPATDVCLRVSERGHCNKLRQLDREIQDAREKQKERRSPRKKVDQHVQSEKAVRAEAERLREQLEQERNEKAQTVTSKREADELHEKQVAALNSKLEASETEQRVAREVRIARSDHPRSSLHISW